MKNYFRPDRYSLINIQLLIGWGVTDRVEWWILSAQHHCYVRPTHLIPESDCPLAKLLTFQVSLTLAEESSNRINLTVSFHCLLTCLQFLCYLQYHIFNFVADFISFPENQRNQLCNHTRHTGMSNVPHHSVSWLPDSWHPVKHESHVEEEQNSSKHKSKSASLFITGLFVFEEDMGKWSSINQEGKKTHKGRNVCSR